MYRTLSLLSRAGVLALAALFVMGSAALAAPPGYYNARARALYAQRYLRALQARRAAAARAQQRALARQRAAAAAARNRQRATSKSKTSAKNTKTTTTKSSSTAKTKSTAKKTTPASRYTSRSSRSRRYIRVRRTRPLYFPRDAGTRYGSPAWQHSPLLVMLQKSAALLPGQAVNWVAPPVTTPYRGEKIVLRNSATGAVATYRIQEVQPTRVSAILTAPSHQFQLILRRSTGADWRLATMTGLGK
ncbi:MAG TPA: hypothetical protein VFJ58_15500 [Armatimonadota bacterium]|nr:hypothetical protein [Armatimonadota bacterium]